MAQYINPKTGEVGEDKRGTVSPLEDKIAFSIGRLTNEISALQRRQDDLIDATKNSFAEFKGGVGDELEEIEERFQSQLTQMKELNEKEHKQLAIFTKNLRTDLNERYAMMEKTSFKADEELDKRLRVIEHEPLERAKRIMGFSSDLFWKILVPILTAGGTALFLLLIGGGG